MKNVRKLSGLALMTIMAAVLTACQYKDLEEAVKIPFRIDFSHSRVDSVPKSYRVAFYPADEATMENITKGYMMFDVPSTASTLELPAGRYKVTAFNNDIEHVLTDGYGSQMEMYAKTPKARPHGVSGTPIIIDSLYGGQTVMDYPDYMTHVTGYDFTLNVDEEGQRLTLTPDSMVVTVMVRVAGIKGLSHVKEVRGSINNVAGTRLIAQDNITRDTAAVIFNCRADASENTVQARLYVFGVEPTANRGLLHTLILYFWMEHGTKVYIPVDVTKILAAVSSEDKYVFIDIPDVGIDLEKYDTGKNTFNTEVEEWKDEHVELSF